MPSVYSKCLAQPAGAGAQILRLFRPAVRAHQFNTLKRRSGTDQNGFSSSCNSGCYIEAVVNAIDKIYVSQTAPFEHGPVPLGSAPEGMACGIILCVSFGFHNNPGNEFSINLPSQKAANKGGGKDFSASAEKSGRGCCEILQNSPPVSGGLNIVHYR